LTTIGASLRPRQDPTSTSLPDSVHGWAGFSFDVLARRARVGKAALYGKWGSKERLIVAALTAWCTSQPPYAESGSLRRDLAELAARILRNYLGQAYATLRR
jgi:AcrR family transcriptional regulator